MRTLQEAEAEAQEAQEAMLLEALAELEAIQLFKVQPKETVLEGEVRGVMGWDQIRKTLNLVVELGTRVV